MKIGIISPHPPIKGGIAKETEIIYSILKDIADVKVFSYKNLYPKFLYPDHNQFDVSYKKNNNVQIDFCLNSYNIFKWKSSVNKIIKYKCSHLILRFWNPFFIPLYLYIINRIRRENKNIRIYCICDNVVPHERFIFDQKLIKYFLKKNNGFMVMSSDSKDKLKKIIHYDKIIIKSFLPIKDNYKKCISKDEALKTLQFKKPKLLLLKFGIVRNYKGLDTVLNVLARLKDYDIKLLIAGKCYQNKERYIKFIDKHNLEDKIIWHDEYIPESKVHLYFSAADAVILPHKKISQSGIIPLAYHFNKLVIARNLKSFKEQIVHRKTGYLFDNKDLLKRHLIDIYDKHNFKLSEMYIKDYKKQYSNEKIKNDFNSLLQL